MGRRNECESQTLQGLAFTLSAVNFIINDYGYESINYAIFGESIVRFDTPVVHLLIQKVVIVC